MEEEACQSVTVTTSSSLPARRRRAPFRCLRAISRPWTHVLQRGWHAQKPRRALLKAKRWRRVSLFSLSTDTAVFLRR